MTFTVDYGMVPAIPTSTATPASRENNQISDLVDVNAFTGDAIATRVVTEHAPWAHQWAEDLGARVWSPQTLAAARDAHRHLPELVMPMGAAYRSEP